MNEWKRPFKKMDKLEKRDELKRMYRLGNWKVLENVNEMKKEDFANILPGLKLAKEIRSFLFECAHENIDDSVHYVKIMNHYLGLDTRNNE